MSFLLISYRVFFLFFFFYGRATSKRVVDELQFESGGGAGIHHGGRTRTADDVFAFSSFFPFASSFRFLLEDSTPPPPPPPAPSAPTLTLQLQQPFLYCPTSTPSPTASGEFSMVATGWWDRDDSIDTNHILEFGVFFFIEQSNPSGTWLKKPMIFQ